MFALQAKAPIIDVLNPRSGGFKKSASLDPFKGGQNILQSPIFEALAGLYCISPRVQDYVFLVAHAVTADVANDNGDIFPRDELLRFDQPRQVQVYRTFQNGPFHQDHKASDRTAALGFIPDCTWMYTAEKGGKQWVDCLVAIDAVKRPDAAKAFESGKATDVSMGCLATSVQCDGCRKIARTESELCWCLRNQKKPFGPRAEICRGVTFGELSWVGDGADPDAVVRAFLGKAASRAPRPQPVPLAKAAAAAIPPMDRMGLTPEAQLEINAFYRKHGHLMPQGMIDLAERIF